MNYLKTFVNEDYKGSYTENKVLYIKKNTYGMCYLSIELI